MKTYRCVVRSATDPGSQTLHLTAADCRAAASAAVEALLVGHSDWIEVWDRDELVLKRRLSNLYPAGSYPPTPPPKNDVRTDVRTSGKPLR